MLVTAGDNPDRLVSEASFAHPCAAAPVPAASGRTDRHRLNRGGARKANRAPHTIVLVRMGHDARTRDYVARVQSELPGPVRPCTSQRHKCAAAASTEVGKHEHEAPDGIDCRPDRHRRRHDCPGHGIRVRDELRERSPEHERGQVVSKSGGRQQRLVGLPAQWQRSLLVLLRRQQPHGAVDP
ncbi:transposase [Streptomyces sp. NPDC088560]|uniref:transposase n=1 Tax=Streptomyces sp. NPDC088560 TaxID=3365868 RepID=UPI00381320CD